MGINKSIHKSLVTKLLCSVGAVLLLALSIWGYFNLNYVKHKSIQDLTGNIDRLSNTIRLGLHYAMTLNSRDDIKQIILNISRQNDIENIRIYNKNGEITFSNHPEEVEQQTKIKSEACYICHNTDPPTEFVELSQRVRVFESQKGYRLMGIISPVYNEAGCSTDACHIHPPDKKVLGALDLVVSLKQVDSEIANHQRNLAFLAAIIFVSTAAMIVFIIVRFVINPISNLIQGARRIEKGDYATNVQVYQNDEMQEMAQAINQMGTAIGLKTAELNRQRDEYQSLFELVPCIISVQDRDYRLIGYNREFAQKFDPHAGDYCYKVYKGLDQKCVSCPVQKTFEDGHSHYSEESGFDKDGTAKHWIVRTTPIKDADGHIVAAMEINLDITERKRLEERLEQSEKKYHAIFNNIPNPVFVLEPQSLEILDCNHSVGAVYGFARSQLIGDSFLNLFSEPDGQLPGLIRTASVIERAKHRSGKGLHRYVTIRISPSEYGGHQVLLVTISDITKRLEAEQQLIQASKMATLGEMATGVAHELNQPLSVIKTASNYFMRKIRKKEAISDEILLTMSTEIDSHVQRATRIINHMRQFGRKSDDLRLDRLQINHILQQAFEIFSQQLKVRGIDVTWQTDPELPMILGDAGRLEQVMINLLLNARDAIEEKMAAGASGSDAPGMIRISTTHKEGWVVVRICDNGIGIAPGHFNKIFEPFFTTKKVGQGTGLGLSISYGIIQECHGRIYAQPNADGGSCFVIEFPVASEA